MSKLSTKLKEEFEALLPPTIFFFVALHMVALIRVLMLKGTGITLSTSWQVTVAALILGKAVLVADHATVHQSLSRQTAGVQRRLEDHDLRPGGHAHPLSGTPGRLLEADW